jgi:hypothetical protein
MAARLPLNLDDRQVILELRDEPGRQDFLTQWMNDLIPRLRQQQRNRHHIAGNGHTHGAN